MAISHKRDANARRKPRALTIVAPLAIVATASAVSLGVLAAEPVDSLLLADGPASVTQADDPADSTDAAEFPAGAGRSSSLTAADLRARSLQPLSRSAVRGQTIEKAPTKLELTMAPGAVEDAVDGADTELWTTTVLNLWSGPSEAASEVGEIDEAEEVLVTGRSLMGRDEIVVDGAARWVTAGYLDQDKPEPEETTESGAPAVGAASCTNGSSVASGVSPNVVKVHEAVCAAFPSITTYGTFRSDGEHAQGIAVDIMVSGDTGYQVAEFVRANAGELGVSYAIYAQRIWSVERGGEGWRGMSDRGSSTANHYDHVHVTTY